MPFVPNPRRKRASRKSNGRKRKTARSVAPQPEAFLRLPCVCANLHRTERTVEQLFGAELRKAGLRTNQFTLMEVLKFRPGATQASLSATLNLDISTLTRTLNSLQHRGYIRFTVRDGKAVHLTAKGERILTVAEPRWLEVQGRLKEKLGRERWKLVQSEIHELGRIASTLD